MSVKHKIFLGLIVVLFLLNIFAWHQVFAIAGPRYLEVSVLDIGQGDAIFIETPNMRHMLIDGGPDVFVMDKLQKRLPFWEKSLDVVVLTHPDSDHLNGLLQVLKKYKVDYIIWTGIVRDGMQYQKWIELLAQAEKRGSKIIIAKMGDKIINGNVVMDILNPVENISGQYIKTTSNETGLVLKVAHNKNSFLLTADTGFKTEEKLLSNNINVDSDVLKVAHHGSKYSSSEEFLQAVSPRFAAISVSADNSYGHPTPEVLQKLEKFGITTFRTDQQGDIEILSDGENIKVK